MIFLNYLFLFFVWIISKIPFRILYILSDFFYFILFYIISYRKNIVLKNLHNSFPEKDSKEVIKMAKQYYHNLCDITIETIKKKGMKEKDYQKRFKLKNFELLNKLHKENKSVIGSIGHCANFEWVLSYMPLLSPYDTYVTYQPLNNKFFDDYMLKSRSVFGLKLYHHKKTYEVLDKNKDICTLTVIGGDQAPPKNRSYYWTTFLNQDTSFYIGIEKIAKLYNLAVVFFDVYKIKRGHYQIEVKLITDDPIKTKEYEIIEAYKNKLEDSIKIHPADWLWSHRRWKYKKEDYINT